MKEGENVEESEGEGKEKERKEEGKRGGREKEQFQLCTCHTAHKISQHH